MVKASRNKSQNPSEENAYVTEASEVRQLNEPEVPYIRLDPAKHGRVIYNELTEEEEAMADDPDVKPFSHVSDSAAYVRRIRRDFRC